MVAGAGAAWSAGDIISTVKKHCRYRFHLSFFLFNSPAIPDDGIV